MRNIFSNKYLLISGPLVLLLIIVIKNDDFRSILFITYLLTLFIYFLHESTFLFQKSKFNRHKIFLPSNLDIRNKIIDLLILIIPALLLGIIFYFDPEILQEILKDGHLQIILSFGIGILIIILIKNPVNELVVKNNKLLIKRNGRIIKELISLNKIILSNNRVIFKTKKTNIELSGLKIKGSKNLIANRLKELIPDIEEIKIENNGLQPQL